LSAQTLAEAAANNARALGYFPVIDNSCDEREYRTAASHLLDRLRTFRLRYPRVCVISTGEVSVTLPANDSTAAIVGLGGRNQQFALYAATLLRPEDNPISILSAGSDGIDGNSPAAGAVVDCATIPADELSEATHALEQFDTYSFLSGRGAAIGRSGNNLRDLRILIAEPVKTPRGVEGGPEIP
jgi:hydroxypyruvate reductase